MTFPTRPFQGRFGEVQAVNDGADEGFFRESHDGDFYTVYGCDPAGAGTWGKLPETLGLSQPVERFTE